MKINRLFYLNILLIFSFIMLVNTQSNAPSPSPTGQPTSCPSIPTSLPSSQPSAQPVLFPTGQPSRQPSSQPTSQPTSQPSLQPSVQPTSQPSGQPSSQPSRQPSTQPSGQPSGIPSSQPTLIPTSQPTFQPSNQPTGQPTFQPTVQPTMQPSTQPTGQPSGQPTGQPSLQPSGQPSQQPTGQPTVQPTTQPTGQPTIQPTTQPSGQPTRQPTGQPSRQPTIQPTAQPSTKPTGQPSRQPSTQPTGLPTNMPSSAPSRIPSTIPTRQPTNQPTTQPTRLPTGQPSRQPSTQPTMQPTGQPTTQPSSQPTCQPTSIPSSVPTTQPTAQPTRQPSSQPTRQPTRVPSCQPTGQPSGQPTSQPSGQPSSVPTTQPSIQPSSQPTSQPSRMPSGQPSGQPTSQPSRQPSSQPTSRPSSQPSSSPTTQPTRAPTTQPSGQPSRQPTTQPTGQPSRNPTCQPTTQPSSQPTSQPTCQPSGQPSRQPTRQPTMQPTSDPSMQPTGQPTTVPTCQPSRQPTTQPSGQPTGSPTMQPSAQPTRQPSASPSRQPSMQPTSQPTSMPSSNPTMQPSSQPTSQPSSRPSRQPSGQPSRQPTSRPSCQPTMQPSGLPTNQPSSLPTLQPTSFPTSTPTSGPTMQPSNQPTSRPSRQPSSRPTSQPSRQPTAQPSRKPSGQPTRQPSITPSGQPSSVPTRQPSATPTRQPSSVPTRQPTCQPTSQPTRRPSRQPSGQPTSQPTRQPSSQPTSTPSRQPSSHPSAQPSGQPSFQPSGTPSSAPTKQPSGQPSGQPTGRPSNQPSRQPTRQPTSKPSNQPTMQPSSQPSSQPSRQPSNQPTMQPSAQPTNLPSSNPTCQPTTQPSTQPTSQPSRQPSSQPTSKPTNQPTRQPTRQPTGRPSCVPSGLPTGQPSRLPTGQPSSIPSMQPSGQPTGIPTSQPSAQPSSQPSRIPSGQPTMQPSGQPSSVPSAQPSTQPTRQPSGQPTCKPSMQPSGQPTTQPSNIPTGQPTMQPSGQPSNTPSAQPSRQPTGQPSRQPTTQPTSQPSTPTSQPTQTPTSQPSCRPSSQPSSQPSTALQIQLQFNISQQLYGINSHLFLINSEAKEAFRDSVRQSIGVPRAFVIIHNATRPAPIISNILRNDDREQYYPHYHHVALNEMSTIVFYTLSFMTAEVASNLTRNQAFQEVKTRLTDSISTGNFSNTIQSLARQQNISTLFTTTSMPSGLILPTQYVSTFLHSAFPTSFPSGQPSRQPSGSPSGQPTSAPSLTHVTRFNARLKGELTRRFQNPHAERDLRTVYFEMSIDNDTYFGGENTWNNYVKNVLPYMQAGKSFSSLIIMTISGADEPTTQFHCNNGHAIHEIYNSLLATSITFRSIPCNGSNWMISSCGDTVNAPRICANCENEQELCQDGCAARNELLSRFSSVNWSCKRGFGYIQMFYMTFEDSHPGGDAVVITFGTLWGALIVIALSYIAYQRQQVHKKKESRESFLTPKKQSRHVKPSFDFIISQLPYLKFIAEGKGSLEYYGRCLMLLHRDMRVFTDKKNGFYYGLLSVTSVVLCAFFVELLLDLRYPFDYGKCAEQLTESSCTSLRSSFIDYKGVCKWVDNDEIEKSMQGSYEYQTSCLWRYEHILVKDRILIALIVLLFLLPLRNLLEKLMKRYLLPETIDEAHGVQSVPTLPEAFHRVTPMKTADEQVIEIVDIYQLPEEGFLYNPTQLTTQIDPFEKFAEALNTERTSIDRNKRSQLDSAWGLNKNGFQENLVIKRDVSWSFANGFYRFQIVADYYYEYLRNLTILEIKEREDAQFHANTLPQRILRLFILDMLGYFSWEAKIISRRTYREATPRKPVLLLVKMLVFSVFMLVNVLFLYYFWNSFRRLNVERQYIWFSTWLVCLLIDMGVIENVYTLWSYYVVPSWCYGRLELVLSEIQRLFLNLPEEGEEKADHNEIPQAMSVHDSDEKKGFKRLRTPSPSKYSANSSPNNNNLPPSFETTDHFFLSKVFAKLCPEFIESKMILSYHSKFPNYILMDELIDFNLYRPISIFLSPSEFWKKSLLFLEFLVYFLGSCSLTIQYFVISYTTILFIFFMLWLGLTESQFTLSVIWWIVLVVVGLLFIWIVYSYRSNIFRRQFSVEENSLNFQVFPQTPNPNEIHDYQQRASSANQGRRNRAKSPDQFDNPNDRLEIVIHSGLEDDLDLHSRVNSPPTTAPAVPVALSSPLKDTEKPRPPARANSSTNNSTSSPSKEQLPLPSPKKPAPNQKKISPLPTPSNENTSSKSVNNNLAKPLGSPIAQSLSRRTFSSRVAPVNTRNDPDTNPTRTATGTKDGNDNNNSDDFFTLADLYQEVSQKRNEILQTLSHKDLMTLHQLSRSNSEKSLEVIQEEKDGDLSKEKKPPPPSPPK